MTFKILTDSTADLLESWAQENNVQVLGLTIQLDGQTYETVGPDKLTSDQLLAKMETGSKPTTSQINVGQLRMFFVAMPRKRRRFSMLPLLQLYLAPIRVQLWHGRWF